LAKVPFNPRTGRRARSNDHQTFSTLAEAEQALATEQYEGLCVLVAEELGITMLDFDDVIPEDRAFDGTAIPPRIRRIMRMANSPVWWTPSGTGLRAFMAATTGQTYKNKTGENNWITAEQYTRLRFATVMPDRQLTGTPDTFNPDIDDLIAVLEALGFAKREPEQEPSPAPAYVGGSHTNDEIVEAAGRVYGDKFQRLHVGDISGYPESQTDKGFSSEADGAIAMILCGFTDSDDQVSDIMRTSGLYRRKYDRSDYLPRTIASARAKQRWWFDWERRQPPPPANANPTQHHAFDSGDSTSPGAADDASCSAQLMAAQREIRELKATVQQQADTIDVLRQRIRLADEREAVQRNTRIGAARQTGAALASLFREERPKDGTSTPYRMPLAKLADRTGQSPDTCSRQLKQLAKYLTPEGTPLLHVETREIPRTVNQETGEITEPHKEIWIGPGVEPSAFGYVLATLNPTEAPKHGGKPDRNMCPDHPHAGVIRRTRTIRKITHECAECSRPLDASEVPVGTPTKQFIPAPTPIQQDAFGIGTPAHPTPQDAASMGNHTGGNDLSGKMRHWSPPLDDEPPDFWPPPTSVAGDDSWTRAGYGRAD
jgi:putative DNA primase/helicase